MNRDNDAFRKAELRYQIGMIVLHSLTSEHALKRPTDPSFKPVIVSALFDDTFGYVNSRTEKAFESGASVVFVVLFDQISKKLNLLRANKMDRTEIKPHFWCLREDEIADSCLMKDVLDTLESEKDWDKLWAAFSLSSEDSAKVANKIGEGLALV
ncbi:hypothetical protein BSR29_01470 [Boudabousia liubingyangii]|uniref:Uncharacterized protein n=1 Tax=Boudabousia liubingyangii TaxID=1921764 RepID=A0A1Q5PQ49_9ACTO|nr:hypothetical protein [Boudabousia liubingyangii]OKL49653.1 hypothetical protein BSR29_01470 [Boudabousia liubingyangii]